MSNQPQHPKLKDGEWLAEQYVQHRRTMSAIAEELGVDKTTVSRAMKRHGIDSAGKGRRPVHPELDDPHWLEGQLRTKTLIEIARELGANVGAVGWFVKKHGLSAGGRSAAVKAGLAKRFPDGRTGSQASNWRGGKPQKTSSGYVQIYAPDHPRADNGRVFQHVLIAEKTLGRAIAEDEVVHHINHIKDDNRPENLAVLTRGEHVSGHFSEAVELIKRVSYLEDILDKHGIPY